MSPDFFGNAIWKIVDDEPVVLDAGEHLEHPNGLFVDGETLWIATWGKEMGDDFSTKVAGRIFRVDLKTKETVPLTPEPSGNCDGIESDGRGGFYVTDWFAGKILHVSSSGAVHPFINRSQGAADLEVIPNRLLILPEMKENRVVAFRIP